MKPDYGGVDFGTSNSTAAVFGQGGPRLVALEDQHVTMPSAVFFNFENDRTYFGRQAIEEYTANTEGRLLRALKSILGTSLIREKTRLKGHAIAFSDIIGGFMAYLKERIENDLGTRLDKVVLGRPVRFVDDDDEADARAQAELEQAARSRGCRHVSFQFEPIAAALDYEQRVRREELAFIVDVGGGTSDFSIVLVSPERASASDRKNDILANAGVHIGGTDFDRLLAIASVMPEFGLSTLTKDGKRNLPVAYFFDLATWQRIHLLYTSKAMSDLRQIRYEAARPDLVERLIEVVRHRQGHALAAKVEQAKITLTDRPRADIILDMLDDSLALSISAADLSQAIAEAVQRVADTALSTLRDAKVTAERIDTVFLTGGSTAVPQVRNGILRLFPSAKVIDGDMFGSVGLGLAIDAHRKFG
jgi:hypothetical chaperone protein